MIAPDRQCHSRRSRRTPMEPQPLPQAPDERPLDFNAFVHKKVQEIENSEEVIGFLQKALRESHDRFDLLCRNAPFGYDALDEQARILEVNSTWLQALGYSRDEVVGQPYVKFMTPESRRDLEENWDWVKRVGFVDGVPVRFQRRDGSVLETAAYARVLYDGDGKFMQIHGITYDLTEQKRMDAALRQSEREKAMILEVMSDRVIYLDPQLRVIWANKHCVEPFQMELAELQGSHCYRALYGRDTPCAECRVVKALASRRPEQGELSFGGTCLEVHAYPVLGPGGALTGVVQVSQAITDRKRLERDILEISTQSQQSLGRDLHDGLGQELTGLAFLSRVLHRRLEAEGRPEAGDAAQVADVAERALALTRNLAKGLYPDGLDSDGYLGAIAELALNAETVFGVTCTFKPATGACRVDPGLATHLYYIAQEGLLNAVKHGHAKNIRIGLQRSAGSLVLTVQDNGKGLPARPRPGKGMGLRTMSYRASVLGGSFSIQNSPDRGGGVLLTCTFPLAHGVKP